jgi:hypothetical protein
MQAIPKTNWQGGSPFSAVAAPKRGRPPKAAPVDPVDQADKHQIDAVSGLQITNDPMPLRKALLVSKYESLFANLQPGWCIQCPPGLREVGRVSNALRKWHEARGRKAVIRTCAKYPKDGQGRVWLVSFDKGGKA